MSDANSIGERIARAWTALAAAPGDGAARLHLARILQRAPELIEPRDEALFGLLLNDPAIDSRTTERAGWALLRKAGRLPDGSPEMAAEWLERDELAQALLLATHVSTLPVELLLTGVRRWLLLTGRFADFPRASEALIRQAALNQGAWPFAPDEQAAFEVSPFAPAYLPPRPAPKAAAFDAKVTRAVAQQYESWPYPAWQRASFEPGDTLAKRIEKLGPGVAMPPDDAEILIAGCGTGREAALWANRAPHARVTAIDLSAASLAYAADRCAEAGLTNIEFRQHDLQQVGALGRSFDLIACSGVLHHLADPEAGWAALTAVLKPGGAMRIMVYSKIARLIVRSAKQLIADLIGQPVTGDLLRTARARIIAASPHAITASPDFYTMGGVHDLLLHAHEDAFDIPRIRRGIEAQGLTFLGFTLPTPAATEQYRATHPHDPHLRDYAAWIALERANPRLFGGMYGFWVARPQ
jgi:ubiquinone/menaquinone biosynthesis C-methylase UbiE